VVRHLVAAGHDVHVVTAAPEFVFTIEIASPSLHIRKVLLDCGAVQADALTVDRLASLKKVCSFGLCSAVYTNNSIAPLRFSEFLILVRGVQYHQTTVVPRESILKTEAEWLNSIKALLHGWSQRSRPRLPASPCPHLQPSSPTS
jgi:L-arabinokinase